MKSKGVECVHLLSELSETRVARLVDLKPPPRGRATENIINDSLGQVFQIKPASERVIARRSGVEGVAACKKSVRPITEVDQPRGRIIKFEM